MKTSDELAEEMGKVEMARDTMVIKLRKQCLEKINVVGEDACNLIQ